jgi:hypothetical protein
MKAKKAVLAVLAGVAALATAPVFAHDGSYGGWRHEYHRHYVPAPVYYRPAPAYLAPVVVAPGFSIRFNLPL